MKHFAAAMLAFGVMLGAVPAAHADTTCASTLAGITVKGSIIVPDGSICTLVNVTVTGSIVVQTNATLQVEVGSAPYSPDTTVVGNVQFGSGTSFRTHRDRSHTPFFIVNGSIIANKCSSVSL